MKNNILVIYWTVDGQTKKISTFLQDEFIKSNKECKIVSFQDLKISGYNLNSFDLVILGASVRYGKFPKTLYKFIEENNSFLSEKGAFFGVNLTARKENKRTIDTNPYIVKFLKEINWSPRNAAIFAGVLNYSIYSWYDKLLIKLIMKMTDGETSFKANIEYTNWDDVRRFKSECIS
ncbi:MAG: menaquinone-dependent protoporphyrinogen IX dehydrogenase [Psittacicella sp.]